MVSKKLWKTKQKSENCQALGIYVCKLYEIIFFNVQILGRDASRAYVSGQFDEEGLIDDVTGLSPGDYMLHILVPWKLIHVAISRKF